MYMQRVYVLGLLWRERRREALQVVFGRVPQSERACCRIERKEEAEEEEA